MSLPLLYYKKFVSLYFWIEVTRFRLPLNSFLFIDQLVCLSNFIRFLLFIDLSYFLSTCSLSFFSDEVVKEEVYRIIAENHRYDNMTTYSTDITSKICSIQKTYSIDEQNHKFIFVKPYNQYCSIDFPIVPKMSNRD